MSLDQAAAAVSRHVPEPGEWPCQQRPLTDAEVSPRLVAFLYRLLRDGASAPSDVEEHAIQAGLSDSMPHFTNCHMELYARSLAAHLLKVPGDAGSSD